jgi:hypothetical protein
MTDRDESVRDHYEPPEIRDMGPLADLTLGQWFSRPDGTSGNAGNEGGGNWPPPGKG